jgi:hypothetical protein
MQTASENTALANAESLLEDLKAAHKAFEAWNTRQSEDLPELRQQWLRAKPRDGIVREILEWRSNDPALVAMPEVKAVKKKIAALKAELRQAEDELEQLQTEGTPRDRWERSLLTAETALSGITNGLPGSRLKEHLESIYGTSDFNRLPNEAIAIAKANPEVVRAGMLKFSGRLDPLRDYHTDPQLQNSYAAIEVGIARLRELITGK